MATLWWDWDIVDGTEREGLLIYIRERQVQPPNCSPLISCRTFFWSSSIPHLCLCPYYCSLQNSPSNTPFRNIILLPKVPTDFSLKLLLCPLAIPPPISLPQLAELAVLWHRKQRMQYIHLKLWSEYRRLCIPNIMNTMFPDTNYLQIMYA